MKRIALLLLVSCSAEHSTLSQPVTGTPRQPAYWTGTAAAGLGSGDPLEVPGGVSTRTDVPAPPGYMVSHKAQFGDASGDDLDMYVIGCTNLEQLRFLSPYEPDTCSTCASGHEDWDGPVHDWGSSSDPERTSVMRSSNFHFKPTAEIDWTGINDGADTGRVFLFQNDSDLTSDPNAINFRHNNTSSAVGNRLNFPGGHDGWKLEPGAGAFFLHDEATTSERTGANAMRLMGWTSTRWPRLKPGRLDAEEASSSIQFGTCGSGTPTISKGAWAFTVTPGSSASSCQINFPSGLYSTRPTCTVTPDDAFLAYWISKSVPSSSITVTSNGTPGYYLGAFDVVCVGHEG